jgi:hypothetical protein
MDEEIQLRNYDEFRRKAKALSHIRVTRDGDYALVNSFSVFG